MVIPNGIRPDELYLNQSPEDWRLELEKMLNVRLQDKKVLATVGRLIKRKGIAWFVRVMPGVGSLIPLYHCRPWAGISIDTS